MKADFTAVSHDPTHFVINFFLTSVFWILCFELFVYFPHLFSVY